MTENSSKFNKPEKATKAYNRVVERLESSLADLELRTWETLKEELDQAIEFEQDVAELSKEELSLLGAYIRRDLQNLKHFMAETGEGVSEWVKTDAAVIERSVMELLFSIADKTTVDQVQLKHKLEHDHSTYMVGEIASAGMLRCGDCGYMMCLTQTSVIEPCHECGNQYFKRVTSRWPKSEEDNY
ncbi:MAG: zinc ribbon-containing protein [Pseudomonadales bacterium]|uniref:Metalloendopeptidase n=1 Tax=Oleiphilus messinensis TaxID=141451 RepID=A0A1Y0I843_9GAMM|nr:zinc ribbon-containing protein [Oleiphilus messinensis]ARU55936.1 metalloendopeptidase [Oleiphilus messinensis]MCG8609336.1 zinc ribbon-containing protein [Pseudomonadales bacterium]